jgi:hypothetical protein
MQGWCAPRALLWAILAHGRGTRLASGGLLHLFVTPEGLNPGAVTLVSGALQGELHESKAPGVQG